MRSSALWLGLLAGCGCGDVADQLTARGTRWSDADAAFHAEPRWLGGDGAYTIDLGGDRTLWLFGDSFIATSPARVRTEATMVRNSVAVMTGRELATARFAFAWRELATPGSYFGEVGDHWFWPADGVRLPGGPLVVFLAEQRATPGQDLGFAAAGWRAVRVVDPDAPPASWSLEPVASHAAPYAADATVGACAAVDGDDLVAFAIDGADHHARLARWPLVSVGAGDLTAPAWWDGAAWTAEAALARPPAIVIDSAVTECSLSRAPDGRWVLVASHGFGSTTIAIRTSFDLVSWSAPRDVFTPPESHADHPFVYAGKGHPMLDPGPGTDLVVTYVDNSFTFSDLLDPARAQTLYWPHVARLAYVQTPCP